MIRKIIGSIFVIAGSCVVCWGIWVLSMSLYYLATNNSRYGDAAGIGLPYGIIVCAIGIVPIVIGILFLKKLLSQKQMFIILASLFVIVALSGLNRKVLVLEENAKICKTYAAATFYGYPIGGQIGTYEKVVTNNASRKLISKSEKGLSTLRFIVPYKGLIIVCVILLGTILVFQMRKEKTE